MKNFLRLLRYGLPYTLQWLPGVLLLAAVGVLDTFRVLLLAAHLRPGSEARRAGRPHPSGAAQQSNGTST